MTYCAEVVTYAVTTTEEEFLRLRRAAIPEVKAKHPGLTSVPCVGRREDGSYIDVWVYESRRAAEDANADAPNLPLFMEFFGVLNDVVIEYTDYPELGVSPL